MFVVGLLLGLHLFPGFHNPRIIDAVMLTPDAAPFTMYLNLDKPLVGFLLLLFWAGLKRDYPTSLYIQYGIVFGILSALTCLLLSISIGLIDWNPKFPDFGWLFLMNNLLLVSMEEEAFFRGYLQEGLQLFFSEESYGFLLALAIASILYGLVHIDSGWSYVLLATIAGVFHGLAYRYGGLQSAVIAHFTLNAIHFINAGTVSNDKIEAVKNIFSG